MEDRSDKFTIRVRIGNQEFPITIKRDAEKIYRDACKLINEKLGMYMTKFPNQGNEKYMSMTLLDIAVKLMVSEDKNDDFKGAIGKLMVEVENALK